MADIQPTGAVTRGADRARLASLSLLGALAGTAALALIIEPVSPGIRALLAGFLLVPLALPVPGLWRRHRRTYAWATLCLTPHFVFALTEVVANPALRVTACAMLLLSLGLMVALVAYLRATRGRGDW